MAVEYSVDAHAKPKLGIEPDADPQQQQPGGGAPGSTPVVVGELSWTPQEIEAQLMGVWFFTWVGVCLVRWKRPDFAVNFAAQPGEFSASATALVPIFNTYMPKSMGGPGGVLFAAPIVVGELTAALMRRGPLLEQGPPKAQAAPPPPPGPDAPPPPESNGRFHIAPDLAPEPHHYEGTGRP